MFEVADIAKADSILIENNPELFGDRWQWLAGAVLTRDMFYVDGDFLHLTKDFKGDSFDAILSSSRVQDINVDIKIYGEWYIV